MSKYTEEEYKKEQSKHSIGTPVNMNGIPNLSWDMIKDNIVRDSVEKGRDYIVAFNIYPSLIQYLGYPIAGIIMDN